MSPSAPARPTAPRAAGRKGPAHRPPGDRRPDGSMSLLVDLMTNTLDAGYAEQAARRAQGPLPGSWRTPPGGRAVGVLVLVALGVLTGTAVAQVRDRAAASEGLRGELAEEVRARSAESDRLAAEVAARRAEVTAVRDEALEADQAGRRLREQLAALELAAATVPVSGPGIVLTLKEAAPGSTLPEPGSEAVSSLDGRVLDRDLQDVVNGMWAAGAEAVAVNDVRLSSRAAIRAAGEAVLVDFRPLSPPYVVEAIGRPATLEVGFLDGPAGRRLQTLASFTGISWELGRADRIELPAASEPQLRAAAPAVPGGAS